jgi:hypothetical protein
MASYTFERETRTPHSESYSIEIDDGTAARVDLHYADIGVVHATLCVGEGMTEDEVQELISTIDERLVMSANPLRDDFVVSVWVGRPGGQYSDLDDEDDEDDDEEEDELETNGRH